MLGAVCSIGSVLVGAPAPGDPAHPGELAAIRAKSATRGGTFRKMLRDLGGHRRDAGPSCLNSRWSTSSSGAGLACYRRFVAAPLAKSIWGTSDETSDASEAAVGWTGLVNGWQHRDLLGGVALRRLRPTPRGQMVHSACLVLAAVGLPRLPAPDEQVAFSSPSSASTGVAWPRSWSVPYIMASADDPPPPGNGVYMGIITNMMIVIPMLIQSLTFGFNPGLPGDNPSNATAHCRLSSHGITLVVRWGSRNPPSFVTSTTSAPCRWPADTERSAP